MPGYSRAGEENDNAVGQALMNVLKAVAQAIGCFVLGVDHFGKDLLAGTRGASSKESSGDLVLACLGNKELSGSVTNTRLAVRKHRGGRQGQEYPFSSRLVEAPEPDEDGEPITTMVVDWLPAGAGAGAQAQPELDPWLEGSRRQDQRTAVLRLKRVLYEALAEQGVDLPDRAERSGGADGRHRRSSGSGFMPARQLMKALQSKSDKFGTRSSKRPWIERRSES